MGSDPVLIAAISERCVARAALEREGVDFVCEVMQDDLHYGRFLAENWRGEVIVLEHDVVPWWGGIDAIRRCPEPWCVYRYPFAPNALGWALGCLRVNPELVSAHPDLPDYWRDVPWNGLDAKVVSALNSVSGKGDPHFHGPPFAHVKGLA
jgi:hypothetical protein